MKHVADTELRLSRLEKILKPGAENTYTLAWGRLGAALIQSRWTVMFLGLAVVALSGAVAFLAIRSSRREAWVFVKDSLGNVVQADPASFLKAGDVRDENEIKAYARDWVRVGYEFTPLDVRDRVLEALRMVDPRVHGVAQQALGMAERAQQIEQNLSVRVANDPAKGIAPEVNILRMEPLEVMVIFARNAIGPSGEIKALPPKGIQLRLREVPRTPANGHGLFITDISTPN